MPGFHTAAETALRRGHAGGQELFLSLTGLLASGTRTVFISRWRNGGPAGLEVVRELAQELPHISPAEAWQRAVRVAVNTPLDVEHEPRIKKNLPAGDPRNADHPLFWAGYMLVDSGMLDPDEANELALPGKPARRAKGPQLANPGLAPGVPGRAPPAGGPRVEPPAAQFPGAQPPGAADGQPPEAADVEPAVDEPAAKAGKRGRSAPRHEEAARPLEAAPHGQRRLTAARLRATATPCR